MFPPVPAPFAGSIPQDFAEDHRLSHCLDRCFGAAAILTGVCAGLHESVMEQATWETSLITGCLTMLVLAAIGLWAVERTGALHSLTVIHLYDRVVQHLQEPAGGLALPATSTNPIDSFAGLVSGTVQNLSRSRAAHDRARSAAQTASRALQAGREQAYRLAGHLRGDGAAMADAASGIMTASAGLANDATQTRYGAAATEDVVTKAAGQAIELAGSVRNITAQITRMTEIAVSSADAAIGAQTHLAGLDARARGFETTASQVGRALERAGACGRDASAQAASGAPVSAALAINLLEMAICADEALTAMLTVVAGLRAETAAASRRVAQLSALIESQHEQGDALSHAVEQQGDDIANVLGLLDQAHTGFAAVRAGMDAMGVHNNTQLANAEALRGSINRLPAHADTIASILRGIPNFTPPLD